MPTEFTGFISRSTTPPGKRLSTVPLSRPAKGDWVELVMHYSDGRSERMALPKEAVEAIASMAYRLSKDGQVVVLGEDQELTPSEAAEILGVPPALVVRKMEAEKLPFYFIGAERRCRLKDVMVLKETMDAQQRALNEMAQIHEELIDRHGLI